MNWFFDINLAMRILCDNVRDMNRNSPFLVSIRECLMALPRLALTVEDDDKYLVHAFPPFLLYRLALAPAE